MKELNPHFFRTFSASDSQGNEIGVDLLRLIRKSAKEELSIYLSSNIMLSRPPYRENSIFIDTYREKADLRIKS